ncbi:MAG: N-acyl-D-amino-acid deacylase family protein, partial [Candidatus Binataceae bacterium]
IVAVGKHQGRAAVEIDAKGRALAPGFIDVHSHDDYAVLVTPEMDFKVMQGVTTDVVGNCGFGAAPNPAAGVMFRAMFGESTVPEWTGYPEYLDVIDRNPPSLNVAVLVGHGTIRLAAMQGIHQREPSAAEIDLMRGWLKDAINAGAVGLSTGLVYEPGRYAKIEEIIEVARAMSGSSALYASHMRNEAAELLDAIAETIRIGEEAGVAVQISHHKASGRANWGKVRESLGLIERARARGIDVTADQYPYTSGSTALGAILQNDALGEGRGGVGAVEPHQVLLASVPKSPHLEGKTLAQVATEFDLPAKPAAEKLVRENGMGLIVIIESMDEADVRTVMRHPSTMIGSDGIALGSKPHPRLYGTFPRVLGHYTRELGLLTLTDAVHRMTGMAAKKFRLTDRGVVREGAFADLVVFDPKSIADTATYEDPRRYPTGISHVFVNGAAVVRDATHTGARPGRAMRRG